MRPVSARTIVKWMSVPSVLLALLAVAGFSFAQARPVSSRDASSRSHVAAQPPLRKLTVNLVPAGAAAVTPAQPPNTSDSWTGGGDGTSWNNAANWNNGIPNSSTVDVTIGTTTASVNDNLSASVGNLTLSHAADSLTIANGIALSVFGSAINNAGTITLGSSNSVTELVINAANVTLSGAGTLTMSNNANNYILGAATADTLTNQETIQGAGHIGNGAMTLVNSGTINANQSAGLTIQASGGVTNTGTIKATGGALALVGTTVTNTGGTISANGNTLSLTTTTINGGAVTLSGASTLQLNVATIHGGSTLTNSATGTIEMLANTNTLGGTINNSAGGVIKIDSGAALSLETGTYSQLGAVQLNSTNSVTELLVHGNVILSGGTVTMSNNANNYIFGGATADTLTNQETIQGAGHIGNGVMTLVNSGTINANQTAGMTIQASGGVTNTGTIKATGGALALAGTTVANTGGTISANGNTLSLTTTTINGGAVTLSGASTLQLNVATIHGGSTLTNSATGTIEVLANANTLGGTINNSAGGTFKIDNGAVLNLEAGTYSQLGTVQLNSSNSVTELVLQGNVTLSGGTLTLSNNANNYIFGHASTDVLTNQETIQGAGHIGNGVMGLINSGTILANQSAGITIQPSTAGFTNTGTLGVSGGVLMHVMGGPFTNFSGSTLTGGTYSVSGTLQIDQLGTAGGEIVTNAAKILLNGAGSSFVDQASKDALTNLNANTATGAFTVSGGRNFTTAGNFNNLGTLTVGGGSSFTVTGTLAQISGSTLSGGTFVLGGKLNLGSGINLTTNSSTLTLQGTGAIMSGATNALANLNKNTKSLTLANNANFTTVGNFTNSGALTVNSGSTFAVNGSLTNYNGTTKTLTGGSYTVGGTLSAAGLDIVTDATNLTLSGTGKLVNSTSSANALANLNTIAGTGSLTLVSNATFTAAGNLTNNGKLTINSGSTLSVTGTLTNLSAGTLTGGTYTVGGTMQLAAANGGITTNAANLTLTGTSAKILDGTSNALASFNNNTGTFTLASLAKLTTAASNFTNSGTVLVSKGTTLTVGGTGNSYNQSAGTTTVDGTLVGNGTAGISVTGGKIQGAGTLKANVSIGGGGVSPTLNVGDAGKAGLLKITGTYTQLSTGTMNVSVGGTTVGTQYSQLQVTGTASLGGTLTAALVNAFTPTLGQTFTVLKAASITGTFSNSTIAINGTEHFVVSYTSTSVVLTVASGPVGRSGATAAAAASQMALASTKQAIGIARPPVLISGLGHTIGGTNKSVKPVLVAGLRPGGERSHPIFAGTLDFKTLPTSRQTPILSAWNRTPEKFSHPLRAWDREATRQNLRDSENRLGTRQSISAAPARWRGQNIPASNTWVGVRQNTNVRPIMTGGLGGPGMRNVMPAKIVRPSLLPRIPIRLGR